MSLLDRLLGRQTQASADDPDIALESDDIGESFASSPTPYERPFSVDDMTVAAVRAAAEAPFIDLPGERKQAFIDQSAYMAMVASERILQRNGDVADGIAALTEHYDDIIISHEDPDIQRAYRDFADKVNLNYWLTDSHGSSRVYGNSYLVFAGSGDDCMLYAMNPMRVAVGAQYNVGQRPYVYIGGLNSNGLYNSMYVQEMAVKSTEWPEFSWSLNEGDKSRQMGALLDPERVFHRSTWKPAKQRYGVPSVIAGYDRVADRMAVGEMIRSTAVETKGQIRIWEIVNGKSGQDAKLISKIKEMRRKHSYDLVTLAPIKLTVATPETVAELLADKTWMGMTDRVFRDCGLHLILSSGELMSNSVSAGNTAASDIQIGVALTRLNASMRTNIRIARWVLRMFATHGGDASLLQASEPSLGYRQPFVGQDMRIRGLVPLLQYGASSLRTFHDSVGIDHELELKRLAEELPLRESGLISPYASFNQIANNQSHSSPISNGRPIGPDTNPDNAVTNQENAQGDGEGR